MSGVTSSTATIVVFETQPRWAPELQHQFVDEDVHVVGRSTTTDFVVEVESAERPVGLLEVASDPAGCLARIGTLNSRALPPVVAVLTRDLADLEWPLRELGVTSVVDEFVPGHELAAVCRRLLPD